jgi:RNA ligase
MSVTSRARAAVVQALPQLNTLTKYPSILTLHALGEKGRLTAALTTPAVLGQTLGATEKIDGTNCRLLVFADGSYVVGSRENLLHASGDLLFDPAQGIVEGLRRTVLAQHPAADLSALAYQPAGGPAAPLTVIYGEFYGGRVTAGSKHYGPPELVGFRVFDVAVFPDEAALQQQLGTEPRELALWRESETPDGLRYGQPFLPAPVLAAYLAHTGLPAVPPLADVPLPATAGELTHESMLAMLRRQLPQTTAALHETAVPGKAEGVILRSADRRSIVKVRFEDYERTLKAGK